MNLHVERWIQATETRHSAAFSAAIRRMLLAVAAGDSGELMAAREALRQIVIDTAGVAEVVGAIGHLRDAAGLIVDDGGAKHARDFREMIAFRESGDILANVTFDEAVDAMVSRVPTAFRDAAQRTAQAIAELYRTSRAVAFARSAELAVTERVQKLIVDAMVRGVSEPHVARDIVKDVNFVRTETEAWSESYARMAFRTNLNTAVTDGKFRQAQDPAVRAVVPAFRYDAVNDRDTRPNHAAADGLIFSVDSAVWSKMKPPAGWNCRCTIVAVTRPQLRRMGRLTESGDVIEDVLPAAAHPDPGFR